MRAVLAALAILGSMSGQAAWSDDASGPRNADAGAQPVVVELFTSQGCSSCPPADELLQELTGREDILPLALHVDYWDYIGWKDAFADPAFTTRQRGYVHALGRSTIYTPQMVVAGEDHVVGFRPMQLAELIQKHRARAARVALRAARHGNEVRIHAAPTGAPVGTLVVQLVTYAPHEKVEIASGENAGKSIIYANIVTALREIGQWDGTDSMTMTAQADPDRHAAVILQRPNYGPVVAPARAR